MKEDQTSLRKIVPQIRIWEIIREITLILELEEIVRIEIIHIDSTVGKIPEIGSILAEIPPEEILVAKIQGALKMREVDQNTGTTPVRIDQRIDLTAKQIEQTIALRAIKQTRVAPEMTQEVGSIRDRHIIRQTPTRIEEEPLPLTLVIEEEPLPLILVTDGT
jgi:hypothetical protein